MGSVLPRRHEESIENAPRNPGNILKPNAGADEEFEMAKRWLGMSAAMAFAATGCFSAPPGLIPAPPKSSSSGSGSSSSSASSGSGVGAGSSSSSSSGSSGSSMGTSSSSSASSTTGTSGSERTLTVTAIDQQYVDGTTIDETDSSPHVTGATSFNGTAWHSFSPTLVDAGIYRFDGLPAGSVFVSLDNGYQIETSLDALDVGEAMYGRPNTSFPSGGAPTDLELSLTGLTPWGTSSQLGADALLLYATKVDAVFTILPDSNLMADGGSWPGPPRGATSMDVDFDIGYEPLISANQGDHVYLFDTPAHDLVRPSGGKDTYQVITGFSDYGPWTDTAGVINSLSAAMTPVPQTSSLSVDWRQTAFNALGGQVQANAVVNTRWLNVQASPHSQDALFYVGPALLYMFDIDSSNTDVVATVNYGNPLPASWSLSVLANQMWVVPVTGRTGTVQVVANIGVADALGGVTTAVQEPLIGPAQQFVIDGQPATNPVTLSTSTPLVSWVAPSLGTANSYELLVWDIAAQGVTAAILTTNTSVLIPPGILAPGSDYAFQLSAVANPGVDNASSPLRQSLPLGYADAVSDVIHD